MGDEKNTDEEHGAEGEAEEGAIKLLTEAKNIAEDGEVMKEEVQLNTHDEDKAAVKIQSAYKGFRTRKKVSKKLIDEGRKCERGKKGAKPDNEKKNDDDLKLRESRDERARRLREKFEEIDDEELKYKEERRRKLKEEKSLSIF